MEKAGGKKRIGIVGGGPSAMFVYKHLLETVTRNFTVDIFEATEHLGSGMPYSEKGANKEHITNVSGNEVPLVVTSVAEWIRSLPQETLSKYSINPDTFNEYKVLPRLLFGQYLNTQFGLLRRKASEARVITNVHLGSRVNDIIDIPGKNHVIVVAGAGFTRFEFDFVIICTGHNWPLTKEGEVPGYYDSPYPPSKLVKRFDHTIAVRGSSLTAIDAIRTLARNNGSFVQKEPGRLSFQPCEDAGNFKIMMHSRSGLLPAVRFHLEDPRLSKEHLLTNGELAEHIERNDGFLSLDFIFEKDFKDVFRSKDPEFYERIMNMSLEEFVDTVMSLREEIEPFLFFKGEYTEAHRSIRRKQSVHWKEMLAVLSFAMNYPAKHFSAEDMLRLQKVLMPLISIVIAFVPQSSCEELIALHDAGKLELVGVGPEGYIEPDPKGGILYHHIDETGENMVTAYQTFIDCIGQRHLSIDAFPFKSLVDNGTVTAGRLRFRDAASAKKMIEDGNKAIETVNNIDFYLKVPGIAINDYFQVLDRYGIYNPRIYIMAMPYIGGYNPDYSGLDFCEAASKIIVDRIFEEIENH